MIHTKVNLTGRISNTIIHEYPELVNLSVTPTGKEQIFKHEGNYGYDEVVVNPIPEEFGSLYKPRYISFQMYTGTDLDYELANLDTSLISNFSMMFSSCQNITSLPAIDTSNGTNFNGMFNWCPKLEQVPYLNTSNGTNFGMMYSGCGNLLSAPLIDTSKGIDFDMMYQSCSSLTELPNIDTSNGTNFGSFAAYCANLLSFPNINTSKGTSFSYMASGCSSLTSFPQINTSLGTSHNGMFEGCTSLVTIPELNLSKSKGVSYIVSNCPALENLGGFKNVGQAFSVTANANYYAYKIDLSSSTNLTYTSLMNVINKLYNIKLRGCKNQSLVLGTANLNKLSNSDILIATNKGWNVT